MDPASIAFSAFVTTAAFFGLTNQEFIDRVEEQRAKGHTWQYVGYTPWTKEDSPSVLIEPNGDFPSFILFKLTKPKVKGDNK